MRALILGSLLAVILAVAAVPRVAAEIPPEEQVITFALAELPPEWGITRDKIVVLDCEYGSSDDLPSIWRSRWDRWCAEDGFWGRFAFFTQGGIYSSEYRNEWRIFLHHRELGDLAQYWYRTLLHEAVHFAHANACMGAAVRSEGVSRTLLHHLSLIFANHRGLDAPPDICSVATTPLSVEERGALRQQLPWLQRPVTAYALSEFREYVAETIEAWYATPRWLQLSDPHAYLAIETHGLVQRSE